MLRDIIYYKESAVKYPVFVNILFTLYIVYWMVYLAYRVFFITITVHKSSALYQKIIAHAFHARTLPSRQRLYFSQDDIVEYQTRFSIFKLKETTWILDGLHVFAFIDWVNIHNLLLFSNMKPVDDSTVALLAVSVPWGGKSSSELVADLESTLEESQ